MKAVRKLCLMALVFALSQNLWAVDAATNQAKAQTDNNAQQLLVMLHMPLPHFRPDSNYTGRYADDAAQSARHRIAAQIARQHNLSLVSDWPMPTLGVDCYLMQSTGPVEPIIDTLSHDARVEWVQRLNTYHAQAANDPLYAIQPSARFWRLAEIHQVTTGRNIRIAVIDSGVDDAHPDLSGQIQLKENFIDNNPYLAEAHGTAVAGIIAARAGNGVGIEGVASGAKLLALRACWEVSQKDTQCNSFTLGKALNFAILQKPQVINLSLSGPSDKLLELLLGAAIRRGISIVGAIDRQRSDGGFPASYPGVLAVSDEHTGLLAPGRDIPTTTPHAAWGLVNGSSFACAHVSGLVALLLEIKPDLSPEKIRRTLMASQADLPDRPGRLIDACAAITDSTGTCACSCRGNDAAGIGR